VPNDATNLHVTTAVCPVYDAAILATVLGEREEGEDRKGPDDRIMQRMRDALSRMWPKTGGNKCPTRWFVFCVVLASRVPPVGGRRGESHGGLSWTAASSVLARPQAGRSVPPSRPLAGEDGG
jgi:hypothetical protein